MQQENQYTPDCIRTRSGIYFNVVNPTPEMVDIKDIAWALSRQCRFGAHLPVFYTVAQHSIEVAQHFGVGNKSHFILPALLHDASEAYLLDIPSPVKKHLCNYRDIEDRIMHVIADKFGFNYPLCDEVKEADMSQLKYEWDSHFMQITPGYVMPMDEALQQFLTYFNTYAHPIHRVIL